MCPKGPSVLAPSAAEFAASQKPLSALNKHVVLEHIAHAKAAQSLLGRGRWWRFLGLRSFADDTLFGENLDVVVLGNHA